MNLKIAYRLITIKFLLIVSIHSNFAQELKIADPAEIGFSSQRLDRIDQVFSRYVEEDQMAGSVILLARKGKVGYFKSFGYRDIAANSPMEKNAIFRIASQTKATISVGIMMLQEQGKLLISDPLSKYVPEFKETTVAVPKEKGGYEVEKANRQINLRDLLTHTSGFSYGGGPAAKEWEKAGIQGWYFADRDEPIAATVERMADLPANAQPGEDWVYGYSTDILGVVIERASGMPLDQFMLQNLFEPLGMNDTDFYLPQNKVDRLATVYKAEEGKPMTPVPAEGTMNAQGQYVEGPRVSFSGGAGLLSTAKDYYLFLQMLANGGELNGTRILAPSTVKLMTINHLSEDIDFRPGQGFGLGFSVITDLGLFGKPGSVGEFGWGGAYHSTYWVDPEEELVVVYFTQMRDGTVVDDHNMLRALLYQAIVD